MILRFYLYRFIWQQNTCEKLKLIYEIRYRVISARLFFTIYNQPPPPDQKVSIPGVNMKILCRHIASSCLLFVHYRTQDRAFCSAWNLGIIYRMGLRVWGRVEILLFLYTALKLIATIIVRHTRICQNQNPCLSFSSSLLTCLCDEI